MHLIIPFIGCLAVRNSNSIPFYVFLSLPKSRFNDPNVGSSSSKSHFQAELISCLLTESAMLSTPSLPPSLPPPSSLHPLLYLKIDFHFISIGVDIIHTKIKSISFCGPKLVDHFRLPAN